MYYFLAAGDTSVSLDSFKSVLESITGQFSITQIVAVLAGIIGLGIGFVFMWWGIRKGISSLMGAIKKGKAKV